MNKLLVLLLLTSPAAPRAQETSTAAPAALPGMAPAHAAETASPEPFAGPWEAGEVLVKGSVNVKPKVVSRTGRAKAGKLYRESDVGVDVENITALGSMEHVSVDVSPIEGSAPSPKNAAAGAAPRRARVTYIVSEKPMIKELKVEGARQLSKGSVRDEMTLKEKDFFDELRLREDLIKIGDKYREKGYVDAKADYEVSFDTASSSCRLTIKIVEGKRARVSAVTLAGASGFPLKKLVKKLKNRPKKVYMPQDLEADLKTLSDFYRNNGYGDFKVEASTVEYNSDKSSAALTITVSEGTRQKFGRWYFAGNTVYLSSELADTILFRRGKLFSQERFDETVRAIQERYADKGYLKASVDPRRDFNDSTGELDITFSITERDPVFVGHVDVEGNKATKTHVLKREITQKEGEVFSASRIRRSQEKIFNLGFIDDVQLAINPTPEPDKVDLVFDVAEGKPGMLTAGAGISSREGLVGTLSLNHMNLFGRAQKGSVSWNFGKRVQDYYVSWSTPWIMDKPTTLGADLFNTRRYKPYRTSLSAYTERRTGGKITVAPRFEEDKYHLTTSYTYEKVRISGVNEAYLGELTPGTSVTSSVYVELARDTRDNVWDPTRGSRSSIGLEFTGGPLMGDINYYKPSFSHSYSLKLFSIDDYPFVLALANRLGYVARFGSTRKVPVYERYFLGGAETVRGYNSNGQIGPLNGGRVYDVLNIEFKFPLAREKRRTIVQWAFFLDVGNSWDRFDDVSMRFGTGTSNLKAGAGFGIRFTTPAFPIRLDWGYGFNHKPGEQRSDIYFTLGNLF